MKVFKTSLIALFFLLGTFACQQGQEESTEQNETEETESTGESTDNSEEEATEETEEENTESKAQSTRGQIVELSEAGEDEMLTIKVDHEAIPDFMMAMRMDLKVAQADVGDLKAGDKISFEMVKMEDGFKMQNIEKLPEDTELTLKEME